MLQADLKERNQLLKPTKRTRRAPLDFIGNLLGDVFGVLDQRDALQYHQQILTLQDDSSHAQELLQKQTQVLDVTANILKKEAERIDKQYKTINHQIQLMDAHSEMVDSALQLSLALITLGNTQEALVDVLTDVYHGRMNTRLITPHQLEQELSQLRPKLPHTVRFPPYQEQWIQLYKVMTLRGAIRKQVAIFEVRIPLLTSDEYQIFRALPVPTVHNHQIIYIEATTPYLLVNQQKTWFYPTTHAELGQCRDWDENLKFCDQKQPLHGKASPELKCEIEMFEHTNTPDRKCVIRAMMPTTYIEPLHQANTWITVFHEETMLDLVCGDVQKTARLHGSGLLTLEPGCALRNKLLMITSRTTYAESRNTSFLPHFNLTEQLKVGNFQILTTNLDSDFQELDSAVHQLREERPWNSITQHDIYHYGIGGALWIAITAIMFIGWKHRVMIKKAFRRRGKMRELAERTAPVQKPRDRRKSIN